MTDPSDSFVTWTAEGPAFLVRLANPPANQLGDPLLDGLSAAVGAFETSAARTLIIHSGLDGFFAAGADIKLMADADRATLRAYGDSMRAVLDRIAGMGRPSIAAIEGRALGGGLELALACDLRVALDTIKLGMPPAKLGLVYSHTGLRRFIDAIGAPRTRELFLLGRYIDAPTALAWGLVNRLAPAAELEATALELAAELAGNAPLSQLGNKRVIAELLGAEGELLAEVEEQLIELRRASFASQDMREGMKAFAEKRPPRWRGV